MLTGAIILLMLLTLLAIFLRWSNKSIIITEYRYKDAKVPEDFQGFRITQVSDLQSEYFGKEQNNLFRRVADTRPDIIVFTGDLVDRNHTDYEAGLTGMKRLCAIATVYYINGNHEMALPTEETSQFYDELRRMGVEVLFDRGTIVKKREGQIRICGLSEETVYAAKEEAAENSRGKTRLAAPEKITEMLDQMSADWSETELGILLVHEPQFFPVYCRTHIDLIFAGHAHGGQIRLPFTQGLFAPGQGLLPKLTSGIHQWEHATMIISRGLGNSVFPFRIFNRPEITVTELRRDK